MAPAATRIAPSCLRAQPQRMVLVKLLVDSQRSARMNPKLLSAGLAHFSKNLARSFVPQQCFSAEISCAYSNKIK
jgi:hypothetical protein